MKHILNTGGTGFIGKKRRNLVALSLVRLQTLIIFKFAFELIDTPLMYLGVKLFKPFEEDPDR